MSNKLFFVLIFFILIPIRVLSQDNNPIDKELTECMDKNPSTMGLLDCIDIAYQKWDDELNTYYKKLTNILDDEGKINLKEAQRKWIEFRDLEFKNIQSIYSFKEGTMYLPMQALDRMEIVKKRAMELGSYYNLLTEM
jgi:uncharacterized protein YecT (DUF1311 family)